MLSSIGPMLVHKNACPGLSSPAPMRERSLHQSSSIVQGGFVTPDRSRHVDRISRSLKVLRHSTSRATFAGPETSTNYKNRVRATSREPCAGVVLMSSNAPFYGPLILEHPSYFLSHWENFKLVRLPHLVLMKSLNLIPWWLPESPIIWLNSGMIYFKS